MKKKVMMIGLILSLFCGSGSTVMAAETVSGSLGAYTNENSTMRADYIEYVYKVIDGKVYKRLYNFTQEKWVGDWILVK